MSDCPAAIRWPGQREPFTCRSEGPHSLHRDSDDTGTWQITWTDRHPRAFRLDPRWTARQQLGQVLKRWRNLAGLTIEQVAQHLECSDSKISRVEAGLVAVTPRDVRDLLDLYGAEGAERESLIQTARDLRSAR